MDFKLRTNARYFTNQELLDDLKRVAGLLGEQTIGHREYLKLGKSSCKPYHNRFGGWNKALATAGLKVEKLVESPTKHSSIIWRLYGSSEGNRFTVRSGSHFRSMWSPFIPAVSAVGLKLARRAIQDSANS